MTQKYGKWLVILLGIALLAILLAGCGLLNGRQEAGNARKLILYSNSNVEYLRRLTIEFESKTGIKVETQRFGADEIADRIRTEKKSPKADVWLGGSVAAFAQAKTDGLLTPYLSPQASTISARQKDWDGYWTGVYIDYVVFVSNQKLLAQRGLSKPESWIELLRPGMKGQLALANPGADAAAYTMLATLAQLYGDEASLKYLKQVHGFLKNGYSESSTAVIRKVGAGEVVTGVAFLHEAIRFKEQGMKDLVMSVPQEGTGYEIGAIGIVRGGPEPVAAREFVDWVLSRKAQEYIFLSGEYQFPTLPAAKIPTIWENFRWAKRISYDFVWAEQNRLALIEKWNEQMK
jgi:iron(III) transport system substrate-binding protein